MDESYGNIVGMLCVTQRDVRIVPFSFANTKAEKLVNCLGDTFRISSGYRGDVKLTYRSYGIVILLGVCDRKTNMKQKKQRRGERYASKC